LAQVELNCVVFPVFVYISFVQVSWFAQMHCSHGSAGRRCLQLAAFLLVASAGGLRLDDGTKTSSLVDASRSGSRTLSLVNINKSSSLFDGNKSSSLDEGNKSSNIVHIKKNSNVDGGHRSTVRCFSVIRPFVAAWEFDMFVKDFESWSASGNIPCAPRNFSRGRGHCLANSIVDMVFFWDSENIGDVKRNDAVILFSEAMERLENMPARNYFRDIKFQISENRSPRSLLNKQQEKSETHIMRANNLLRGVFRKRILTEPDDICRDGKEAFIMMESHVQATRDNWLSDLLEEWNGYTPTPKVLGASTYSPFWQNTRLWAPLASFNAMYSTDLTFAHLVDCATNTIPAMPFDVLLYHVTSSGQTPTVSDEFEKCMRFVPKQSEVKRSKQVLKLHQTTVESGQALEPIVGLVRRVVNGSDFEEIVKPALAKRLNKKCRLWEDWRPHAKRKAKLVVAPPTYSNFAYQDIAMLAHMAYALDYEFVLPSSHMNEPYWFPSLVTWHHPVWAKEARCDQLKEDVMLTQETGEVNMNTVRICRRGVVVAYVQGVSDDVVAQYIRSCVDWQHKGQCCNVPTDSQIQLYAMGVAGQYFMNRSTSMAKLSKKWKAFSLLNHSDQVNAAGEHWVCPLRKLFSLDDPRLIRRLTKWTENLPERFISWYAPNGYECLSQYNASDVVLNFEALTRALEDLDESKSGLADLTPVVFASDTKFVEALGWKERTLFNTTTGHIRQRFGAYRKMPLIREKSRANLGLWSSLKTKEEKYPGQPCSLGFTFQIMTEMTPCREPAALDKEECERAATDFGAPFGTPEFLKLPKGCYLIGTDPGTRRIVYKGAHHAAEGMRYRSLGGPAQLVLDTPEGTHSICKVPVMDLDTTDDAMTVSMLAGLGEAVITGSACMDLSDLTSRLHGYHCVPTCKPPLLQVCAPRLKNVTCIEFDTPQVGQ